MNITSYTTNQSSLIVQKNLNKSSNALNLAIERMTTGFRINNAKDNAAGYSISQNLSSKISSYQIAEDNVSMGIDLVQTAQDSIDQITQLTERLRNLAVQAQN